MKKLLLLSALFIFACTDDEGNACVYEPTLTTEAVTDITETSATLNGTIDIYSQNCDTVENILQGFVYSTSSEPTIDDNIVNLDGTSISEVITGLEPNTTYYARVFLVRPLIGIFYGNEVSFVTEDSIDDCDVVYLDDNGVTIKAYPCANIGDVGIVNGVEYTVVDREMILAIVGNNSGSFGTINEDLTKMCTTRITDMSYMFFNCDTPDFNQAIGNWDVSNVTNMNRMFNTECGLYSFNQDLSNWDVSNVTDMSYMFSYSNSFNQDISDWDVSNVTDMNYMFHNANSFNQDIGNWDVSNVNSMRGMFHNANSFNQDIGNWDVSNVNSMRGMFENNQEINQDLSSWAVDNVTQCSFFSNNTPQWTLPQPNFTNCNP